MELLAIITKAQFDPNPDVGLSIHTYRSLGHHMYKLKSLNYFSVLLDILIIVCPIRREMIVAF